MLAGWDIYNGARSPECVHAKEFGSQSHSSHHVILLQQTGWGYQESTPSVAHCSFNSLLAPEVFLQGPSGVPRRPPLFPRSAPVRQPFFQPYGFRDRAQKWELLIFFPWESREEGASRALPLHWALSPFYSSPISCSSNFSVPQLLKLSSIKIVVSGLARAYCPGGWSP